MGKHANKTWESTTRSLEAIINAQLLHITHCAHVKANDELLLINGIQMLHQLTWVAATLVRNVRCQGDGPIALHLRQYQAAPWAVHVCHLDEQLHLCSWGIAQSLVFRHCQQCSYLHLQVFCNKAHLSSKFAGSENDLKWPTGSWRLFGTHKQLGCQIVIAGSRFDFNKRHKIAWTYSAVVSKLLRRCQNQDIIPWQ